MARKRSRRRTDAAAKAARSKRRPRRDRDGLWKSYLHAFFRIFFTTFEPEIAAEVDWETLEHHTVGFRGSAVYLEWKALLHHFYDPFPVVEHFTTVEQA